MQMDPATRFGTVTGWKDAFQENTGLLDGPQWGPTEYSDWL